jgi:collagen type III alpha
MPDVSDVPVTGVPQPRNPAERPASGSARAVSASASVPLPSRAAPSEGDEAPPAPAPQARVYGRPIQPVDTDDGGRREEATDPPHPDRTDHGPSGVPPSRISGRASASAFTAPPRDPGPPAEQPTSPAGESVPPANEQVGPEPAPFGKESMPFGGHPQPPRRPYAQQTDVAGRGRAHVPQRPEYYGELTTDISHRGPAPERSSSAMPAWPPRETPHADQDRDRSRMGGVYPGPPLTSPPAPDQPGGWPPYTDAGRDRFNAEENGPDPFAAEQPRIKPKSGSGRSESGHVRMLPILLSVVIGAVLLVGIAIGIVWLISRGSDSSFNVGAGDCVKRSGNAAVKASCGDAGAYQVVSIADSKDQCGDKRQPYVLNPTKDGKTQVLCLKPSGR